MMVPTKQEIAEANRRRYEELRAAGQELTPKGLPEPTALDGAPIVPDAVIHREQVPAGWYTTTSLRRGEALRIVDDSGRSSVSLIGWRAEDTSERLNCADTVKVQWSAAISKGRVILSDMGRVLLSLVEDTSGAHDLLVGGSTPASTLPSARRRAIRKKIFSQPRPRSDSASGIFRPASRSSRPYRSMMPAAFSGIRTASGRATLSTFVPR